MRGLLTVSVLLGALAACSVAPMRAPVVFQRPAAWPETLSASSLPDQQFLTGFGSRELSALVDEALRNNADLDAAEARIRAADARVKEAGSALLPTVAAGAGVNRIQGSSGGLSATEIDRGVSLSASYEPDFWGTTASARRAARAELRASRADAALLQLTIKASIAETVIDLLAVRAERESLSKRIRILQDSLALVEARNAAGLLSKMELLPYRSALAAARTALAPLDTREAELSAALALLVGRDAPVAIAADTRLRSLTVPPQVGAQPADLLMRRPDLMAAESALAAADANLEVARTAFFPRVTLDVVASHQNPGFQAALTTLSGNGNAWGLGAAVTQTLFDGGRRDAVRAQAQARRDELVANYRQSIRTALLDAQRAFAVQQAAELQRQRAGEVVEHLAAQQMALNARRQAGAIDPLTLLDVEQALLQAEDAVNSAYAADLKASVGLFKALGGGWQSEAMR